MMESSPINTSFLEADFSDELSKQIAKMIR